MHRKFKNPLRLSLVMVQKKNMLMWVSFVLVIVLIAVAIFTYVAYYRDSSGPDIEVPIDENFTTTDILSSPFFTNEQTSLDINIRGVGLGMGTDEVITLLGEPDDLVNINNTPEYAENWGYSGVALGLQATNANSSETALVIHFEYGRVRTINIYGLGWPLLSAENMFAIQAEDYLQLMGIPQVDTDLAKLGLRRFIYTDKGLEIYFTRGKYVKTIVLTYPL